MNRFLKKKDNYDYFDEYIYMVEYIVKSAEILKDVFQNFQVDSLEEKMNQVHLLENSADRVLHKMRNYLVKDFLPPIDREDLAMIGHKLDDIEDGIDEVVINMKILNVTEIKPEVNEFIDLLISCCQAVRDLFSDFKNFKDLPLMKKKVIEINKQEEKGDRIFERLMASLYKEEKDPITLIKWTKIYNCIEKTVDSCEEIGDCIEDVILKNS